MHNKIKTTSIINQRILISKISSNLLKSKDSNLYD